MAENQPMTEESRQKQAAILESMVAPRLAFSGATKLLRRPNSPLTPFHVGMSREGLRSGWEQSPQTIAPQSRWIASLFGGPSVGVNDYEWSRLIGGQLRGKYEAQRQLSPIMQQQPVPSFADLAKLTQRAGAAASSQNLAYPERLARARFMRQLDPTFRKQMRQLTGNARQPIQMESPLMRNMAQAFATSTETHPLVEKLKQRMSSEAQPTFQGARGAVAAGLLGAARGAMTGSNPLLTAAESVAEASAMDLPLLHLAQKRKELLSSIKGKVIHRGMEEAAGRTGRLGRIWNQTMGWYDPAFGELVGAGKDLHTMSAAGQQLARQAQAQPVPGIRTAGRLAQQQIGQAEQNLQDHTTWSHIGQAAKHDVGGALGDIGQGLASAGRAVSPLTESAALTQTRNLLAPQRQAGFVNFMERGKIAAARHHLPCVTVQRHDGKVKVCPHCHQEVTEKSLYRDAKGWLFHRPCFMKGKGSIAMDKESAVALSESNKEEETPGALSRLGYGAVSLGGLAGAAHITRAGLSRINPSVLDMAHSMIGRPEFGAAAQNPEQAAALAAARNSRYKLVRMLSGQDISGVSPEARAHLQDLVFGTPKAGPTVAPRQGDIMLHVPFKEEIHGLLARAGQAASGISFGHSAVLGQGDKVHDISGGGRTVGIASFPMHKWRRNDPWHHPYVRVRPRAITDAAAAAGGEDLVGKAYQTAAGASGQIPYGHREKSIAMINEFAPELSLPGGSNLGVAVMDRLAGGRVGKVLQKITPTPVSQFFKQWQLSKRCKPGDMCSMMALKGVEGVQPGALPKPEGRPITPGDFARMVGTNKPLEAVEINLPREYRNPGYMYSQHLLKYGPMALRALPIAALTAAGTYAGYKALSPLFNKTKPEEEIKKIAEAPVIHERQTNDYNCGPAVLKSVENTMGIGHPNIKSYETETGANDDDGTPIKNLEATAAKHGLKVNSFGQMSSEQLQQATAAGKPVIVAMQMDGEQGGPKGGWEAGHYVVVTGVDGQNVKFMDPSSEAPERTLPLNEFLGRWHDHDHNGKVYQQWGMTLHHPAEVKQAYSGSMGSGATSGQGTDPPKLVDASGSTPAGPENQPASDAIPCDSTHLDNCDQHPDPLVFNMADLEKMASRWSQEIASGNLSPGAMSRIMATRPEGSFVKIKNIGHGGMNVADLGAGNVGGRAGLMVRKLPQYAPTVLGETVPNPLYKSSPAVAEPVYRSALAQLISGAGLQQPAVPKELPRPQGLAALYGPTVEASQELDRVAPGKSLRYLGATSKGIFQEYDAGKGSIVPRQTLLGRLFGRDPERAHMLGLQQEVGAHGFADIKPANLGPSGRIIDFTKEDSPNAMLRGMVTGGEGLEIKPETVFPKQFAKLKAREDKIYADLANPVDRRAVPIPIPQRHALRLLAQPRLEALNRERAELKQEAYRRFHLQRAKHIPDAAPVMAQHTPRPEPTDPGLLRRGWEQAKAEVGSLKTHASDIGYAALPLAPPAALVALAAGHGYYQHQQEKKEKKEKKEKEKRRQEKFAIAPFETMSMGTEDTQEAADNTGAQWTGHGRDNSGSSPWKDRLREIADNYEAHQDSSSAGAGGATQAPSSGAFQTGQSAQNSGATSAPEADGPSMQLDSDTISTGQVPHLNA